MIEIQNLNFSFQKGKCVFSGLDLRVSKGEFVVITGGSGSGKTTLLRLLRFELIPDSGKISIGQAQDAFSISSARTDSRTLRDLRRNVGMVYQDFRLIDALTVYENVALPLKIRGMKEKRIKENVVSTLSQFGISGIAHKYPQELSGGEKQKAAITRAIVARPLVLLADEPTGSLDGAAGAEIIDLLNKINVAGTTLVLATHNPSRYDGGRQRLMEIRRGKLEEASRER